MLCAKIVYDEDLIKHELGEKTEEEYKEKIWEEIKEINKKLPDFKHIKKIEIQSNIKQIDIYAFSSANNLSEIIIHKEAGSISGSPWGCTIGNKAVSWVGE